MKPELKKKWIDALRSGNYEQGIGGLLNDKNRYCCLGVLCDIIKDEIGGRFYDDGSIYKCFFAKECVIAKFELPSEVIEHCGIENDHIVNVRLTVMNDRGMTFNQIADWIEENL